MADDDGEVDEQLLAQAKVQRIDLNGPNGAAGPAHQESLENALEVEMADHLGYDKHDSAEPEPRRHPDQTGLTKIGAVEIESPATSTRRSSRRS